MAIKIVESARPWTIVAPDSAILRCAGTPPAAIEYLESVLQDPRQREQLRTDPQFLRQFRERLRALHPSEPQSAESIPPKCLAEASLPPSIVLPLCEKAAPRGRERPAPSTIQAQVGSDCRRTPHPAISEAAGALSGVSGYSGIGAVLET